jgi:hypothetical protein
MCVALRRTTGTAVIVLTFIYTSIRTRDLIGWNIYLCYGSYGRPAAPSQCRFDSRLQSTQAARFWSDQDKPPTALLRVSISSSRRHRCRRGAAGCSNQNIFAAHISTGVGPPLHSTVTCRDCRFAYMHCRSKACFVSMVLSGPPTLIPAWSMRYTVCCIDVSTALFLYVCGHENLDIVTENLLVY